MLDLVVLENAVSVRSSFMVARIEPAPETQRIFKTRHQTCPHHNFGVLLYTESVTHCRFLLRHRSIQHPSSNRCELPTATDFCPQFYVLKSVYSFFSLADFFIGLISKNELSVFLFAFVYVIECWPAVRVQFSPYLACDWSWGPGCPACTRWNKKGVEDKWNRTWKRHKTVPRPFRPKKTEKQGVSKFVSFTQYCLNNIFMSYALGPRFKTSVKERQLCIGEPCLCSVTILVIWPFFGCSYTVTVLR